MELFTKDLQRVTEEDCKAPWSCGNNGKYFRCAFCGHKFIPGDLARAVYTNGTSGAPGNPLVCEKCDDSDECLRSRWKAKWDEWKRLRGEEFWWFCKHDEE